MSTRCSQGRIKVLAATKNCLEMIFSWPNADQIIKDDPYMLLDFAIVWYCTDESGIKPDQWSLDTAQKVAEEWIKITSNAFVDATVKSNTLKFLANLLNIIWNENLNIHIIRQFKNVFRKASSDYEATTVAGFLKLAIVKSTSKPEIFSFNGSSRKVTASHFACTIMIIHRSRATSLDIENFFALFNAHGGNEIKVIFIF